MQFNRVLSLGLLALPLKGKVVLKHMLLKVEVKVKNLLLIVKGFLLKLVDNTLFNMMLLLGTLV